MAYMLCTAEVHSILEHFQIMIHIGVTGPCNTYYLYIHLVVNCHHGRPQTRDECCVMCPSQTPYQ